MELSSQYNYYDVLEVTPHSQQHEISVAYEKARSTYSTENPALYSMFSEMEARELLQMIEEAYSVLGNKTLRAIYDEKIGQNKKSADVSFEALSTESKLVSVEATKRIAPVQEHKDYPKNSEFEQEYAAWTDWDGEKLKKIREYKHLSIDRMSEITRISSFYLKSVEAMNPQDLPAVVFVRGYVVQMAKTLGLNEKKVADSYIQKFKGGLEK